VHLLVCDNKWIFLFIFFFLRMLDSFHGRGLPKYGMKQLSFKDVSPTPNPQSGGPDCLPKSSMGGPTSSKAADSSDFELIGVR
jgi:hypothetical protein